MALEQSLKIKTPQEKSLIKSMEISKYKHAGIFDSAEHGVRVEIIGDVTPTTVGEQSGVQVFARAWRNGQQLGFGTDGSVEIERFRIFNPPILVDDPTGTIVRTWTEIDGTIKQRKLREDPTEAIRQTLAHTVSLVGKENSQIVAGKIGNTTSTFYPDAGTGGTTVDGWVMNNTATPTWATIRNAAGNVKDETATSSGVAIWHADATNYNYNLRAIYTFDTSPITDTDTIDSATISLFGTAKVDPFSNTPNINIYLATPASNNALVNADYQQIGTVAQSTAKAYADWSTIAYNDFTLTDLTQIIKTGISKFGARNVNYDVDNVAPTKSGAGAETGFNAYYADQAGTTNDPKLVVVHTAGSTFTPRMTIM